jgi:hypothetical protein
MFFFEKKNQKTFHRLCRAWATGSAQMIKSLFASFYSEKEDSFCLQASVLPCQPVETGVVGWWPVSGKHGVAASNGVWWRLHAARRAGP